MVNINFSNCKFSNSNGSGFHFGVYAMRSNSRPISIKVVDCEFSNNAQSVPSGYYATEIECGSGRGVVVGGEVRFDRAKFNGSPGRIFFSQKSADGFKVIFKDCEARDVVSGVAAPPIGLEAANSRNTFGGIEFNNFYIQYNRNMPFMEIRAPKQFNGITNRLKNVKGTFTIKEPGDNPIKYLWGYRTAANVNVSINYKHE